MEEPHNLSYLLRLWTVNAASGTAWRAQFKSLLPTGRIGILDLEALLTYLEWIAQAPSCENPPL